MRVCYPSTPASYFHLLRRQARASEEKPLVAMTPKSLLRHPACVSPLESLALGSFEEVLDEAHVDPARVRRIILATGKLYFDLAKAREDRGAHHVAIVRLEQLYPFPAGPLARILARYPATAELVWAQEEPRNMGAWRFVREAFLDKLVLDPGKRNLRYVGRVPSAAPARGSYKIHMAEQDAILKDAFAD
jgi:2-oxoglutarate dehydrogenase complex dehydrogenase (E1) component-like enzyme